MSALVQPNIVPYVIFPTFGLLLITKRYAGDKVGTKIRKIKEFFEFHQPNGGVRKFMPQSAFLLKLNNQQPSQLSKKQHGCWLGYCVRKRMKAAGGGKQIKNDLQSHLVPYKTAYTL